MRVAYLCCDSGIPIFGTKGSAAHVRELARALAGEECDLNLLVARLGGDPPPGWNLPVHQFSLSGWPALVQDLLGQEPDVPGWERRIKDWRALAYAQFVSQAAQPLLQSLQPDVLYERYSLFSWAGQALAADLGIPHIVEINAPLAKEQARYRQLELRATAASLERRILHGADLIVAVSREVKEYVTELGVPPERAIVMPNGVDVDHFCPQADSDLIRRKLDLEEAFVIGFLGSLKPWHGVDSLLIAAADLPEEIPWRLLLVGDGPQRAAIAEQAAALGIADRLVSTGAKPYEQIPAHLAAFDVAVAPYPALEDYYFSPLKLFEYMAMERPVIAPALGQITEVIAHGDNGWLYPPGNVPALQAALIHLAEDPALRLRLGKQARADVVTRHTWSQNAARLVAWMSTLQINRSRQPRSGDHIPILANDLTGWAGGV